MATVDDKVVAMSFESSKFESGVDKTINALNKLKDALKITDAGKGLDQLSDSAAKVDLSPIGKAVDGLKSQFSTMRVVALSVLANIANKAVSAGAQLIKSLTIAPIMAGFKNYETQINAVQTILANTGLTGKKGMDQVNSALADLNVYANKTVYNFSEMTRNIGTFTAAGVGLNQATQAIKGIANLAALSGSNSQQASSAMYQLSQAIAAGSVKLQDWNSVVNAGMGGAVFQKALFNTAKAMGTITNVPVSETFDEWKKAGNSFRQSISATAKEASSGTSALKSAQEAAAKSVSDAQEAAATSTENAAQRVKDAQAGVADTARQTAADVKSALKDQSDTVKKAGEDVQAALDGVREARKRLAEAMKPPSQDELQAAADNLETAQLDQQDLSDAVTQAQQDQTRSAEDLATAQKKLAAVQADTTSTPEEIQAAQRAVQDAQQRVTDAADAQTRALLQQRAAARDVDQAQQDLQTTQEKGTKKDQNVKDAQDALTAALGNYKDAQVKAQQDIAAAEDKVRETRLKSAQSQEKAGQDLANAEKDQAKTIRDAQKSIVDAHQQAAQQINAAEASIATKAPTSWLTSDVLTNTLQQFTGDMTDAQLAAEGFTDAQIKAIQAQAKVALGAATNIKTMSQLSEALKEEVATAWAAIFKTIFGDIHQATAVFSVFHIAAENALTAPIYALNKLLEDWSKLGGRAVLITAITNVFKDLAAIAKVVGSAFKEIFPPATGKQLYDMTVNFSKFVDMLKPSVDTLNNLKRTFAGLFAILDIGRQLVSGIFTVFKTLFGVVASGGGGFLDLTGNIGDFLVSVDKALKEGDKLHNFFVKLANVLAAPVALLTAVRNAIIGLFAGFTEKSSAGFSKAASGISNSLSPVQKMLDLVRIAWDKFVDSMGKAGQVLQPAFKAISDFFQSLGPAIASAVQNMNFGAILEVIRTGLLGGIFLLFKRFLGKGSFTDQLGKGLLGGFSDAFETLTGTLKAMQQNIKADTLMKIAIALGVLTASIVALSFIDEKKLDKSMATLAIAMGELLGAMAIMDKIGTNTGFLKMPFIAASMIGLAIAIDLLVLAVMGLSRLSWNELAKGLAGVAALMTALSVAVQPLSRNAPSLILAGVGISAIAVALNIMALAVRQFGSMDLASLGKGLAAVALSLTAIGLAAKLFPPTMPLIGAGLILVAIALEMLTGIVKKFGGMDWKVIGKGLLGIAGSLVAIGLAMQLMPPSMVVTAAGLILVGIALHSIANAVTTFGGLSIREIAKGIGALGASLVILASALMAMSGSLAGAVALGVAAAGLALLAPAMVMLGKQSWSQIVKGLVGLAAALAVLGVAGLLLEPVAPALLLLGAALLAIGGGLALAGAGIALIGIGLSSIAVAGPTAMAILIKALLSVVDALPVMSQKLIMGLLAIANSLADTAPKFVDAIVKILETLVDAVIKIAPKLGEAFTVLLETALKTLRDSFPMLVQTGIDMLLALLKGINDNIQKVISMAVAIVVNLVTALGSKGADLVTAGYKALTSFLGGIANNMSAVISQAATIIANFVVGIANSAGKLISAGVTVITTLVKSFGDNASRIISAGADAIDAFVSGIGNNIAKVTKSAVNTAGKFMDAIASGLVGMTDKGAQALINLLNGIADAIKKYEPQIIQAGFNIGVALVQGMIDGLGKLAPKLTKKITHLIGSLPKKALGLLGISSPSTVFMEIGQNIVLGLAAGIDDNADIATSSIEDMTNGLISTMSTVPDALDGIIDMEPVIAPVLDLTAVQAGADQMNQMINPAPTVAATSFGQASAISTDQAAAVATDDTTTQVGPSIVLEQNNYSPEALSEVEIYRQTKNQLSQLKTALA